MTLDRTQAKRMAYFALGCVAFYTLFLAGVYFWFSDNLPNIDELESFQPKRTTKIFSTDGKHLKDFLEENREILTPNEIPQSMKDALVAIEDKRFYSHWGIDVRRILGAFFANLKSRSMTAQGASTLTQQLARNYYDKVGRTRRSATLDDLKATFARKIREQITAVNIERLYTKQEILTMYLNTVFFGHGRSGLKTASRYYFDKAPIDLTLEESAMLAGVLKAPTNYSPINYPTRALERRNLVLYSMVLDGKISRSTYDTVKARPIQVRCGQRAQTYGLAPYFIEYVRPQLEREYGRRIYRDGLTVNTTLDSRLQQIATKHLSYGVESVQQKVDAYLARRTSNPDLPDAAPVQAALVAMDPYTGHILAMVGGRDFVESKYNRATQALRSPGSSFKPFVYTAAIDNGRFATDVLEDNAISIRKRNGEIWDPENYDKKFKGTLTLREGLKQSRNLISIKLGMEIGLGRIARYARNMGITSPLNPVESLSIGTSAVHLLDLVAAYSVFPNKGIFNAPQGIASITDETGAVVFQPAAIGKEVLRPSVSALMVDMLRSVIDEYGGTGNKIRSHYNFNVAAAGKTGTTNDYADAWFVGFTPHLAVGVWVGMDDPSMSLWPSQSGAAAALPIWVGFMKEVYTAIEFYRDRRGEGFDYPENLVGTLEVCQDTHLLASKYCPQRTQGLFIKDGVLPDTCALHSSGRVPGRGKPRF